MSDGWPTNDELVSLHSELRDAARGAFEKYILADMFDWFQQQFLSEANYENIIANDPAALKDLFADYSQVQAKIPPPDDALFREITDELNSWTGDAASAFSIQLGDIHTFLGEQALYCEEMKGCINGAYLLSVEARKSYRSLAEETTKVLRKYEETEEGSTLTVVISVVAGVVLGALGGAGLSVGFVVLGALAGGATAGVQATQQPVGGENPLAIVESYVEALGKLNRNLDEEGAELATAFQQVTERVVTESTDISSPLPIVGSYEDFQSPFRPAGGAFDETVQQELDRPVGWPDAQPPVGKHDVHSVIRQALG